MGAGVTGGVTYRAVPPALAEWFATLHRGEFPAGVRVRMPALLGQVWLSTVPLWWVAPRRSSPVRMPTVAVIGPTTAAFEIILERPGHLLGCGLWPLGWAELVGRNAAALSDTAVDASEIWPEPSGTLAIDGAAEREQGWLAIERFAAELGAQAVRTPDRARIAAIDAWLATGQDIGDLCTRLGRSPRQVARITCRTHGGPPRLIAAKWRTLRAAAELGLTDPVGAWWSDRFADQSHLIREFRRFIGETPRGFSGRQDGVQRRVVADPWHLESDHPLALFRSR